MSEERIVYDPNLDRPRRSEPLRITVTEEDLPELVEIAVRSMIHCANDCHICAGGAAEYALRELQRRKAMRAKAPTGESTT